jgi:acyl-CoA thioesterase I
VALRRTPVYLTSDTIGFMKWYVGIGALLILLGGVFFFHDSRAPVTNYPPPNPSIVAFGDSLVFGQGATEGNDFVSVLSRLVGRPIENLGVSGNTTGDGLTRVREVTNRNPGIAIILLGGNDTLRRVPPETTERNLGGIVETVSEGGAVVILVGVRGGILGTNREEMYERIAKQYGAVYVSDILEDILLDPSRMSDGIHPNDAGYAHIAERLYTVFREYDL